VTLYTNIINIYEQIYRLKKSERGFKTILNCVYRLREFAYLYNFVILMSIDKATITPKELKLLEKETKNIESRLLAQLSNDLVEILKFVYKQNSVGIQPSYILVGSNLQLSRPTARRRIKQLVLKNLLIEYRKGRGKALEVSERGRRIYFN